MNTNPAIDLIQQENFLFRARFGGDLPEWLIDEPEPIGSGKGPSPEQLLVAAVAYCLTSSLHFALRKFHNEASHMNVHAQAEVSRNEHGRLRVMEIRVEITLNQPASGYSHLQHVLSQFEDFCTVSQSVRQGLPVRVTVRDSDGQTLK